MHCVWAARPERRAQWLYGRKCLVSAGPFSILLAAQQAKNASCPTHKFMRGAIEGLSNIPVQATSNGGMVSTA